MSLSGKMTAIQLVQMIHEAERRTNDRTDKIIKAHKDDTEKILKVHKDETDKKMELFSQAMNKNWEAHIEIMGVHTQNKLVLDTLLKKIEPISEAMVFFKAMAKIMRVFGFKG